MRYLLYVGLIFLLISVTAAQEGAAIPPCTEAELENLQPQIEVALDNIRYTILTWDKSNVVESVEDTARAQRSFSYILPSMPACAETYLRAYPLMFALGELAIARGLMLAAALRLAQEDGDAFEDIMYDAQKHLREAARILGRAFPDFYEEHVPDDWRP